MFSSRLIDTSNQCNIIKKSLLDDLKQYSVSADGNTLRYSDNTTAIIGYKLPVIGSLALESYSTINNDTFLDCWLPVFVTDDRYIDTKFLSDDGSYSNGNQSLSSGRIGIENFLSFRPNFETFNVSQGTMSTDWILNRHNVPYAVYYGIMCWIKRHNINNTMIIGGAEDELSVFPVGSRLVHRSRPNDILIKISNTSLYIVNSERYSFSSNGVSFNNENNFVLDAETLAPNLYSLADSARSEIYAKNSIVSEQDSLSGIAINGITNNVSLWIPDGDFFSYYDSEAEYYLGANKGIPSNGFVSPCLTKFYTSIYRILTLDEIRTIDKKNLTRARCYRKLAHALSTSPFINELSVRSLDNSDIKRIVNQYIVQQASSRNIADEIFTLKTALQDISLILQKTITKDSATDNNSLFLDTKANAYSLNNNYITNYNQLFTKLLLKYGSNLLLNGSSEIQTKPGILNDNSGVVITQAVDYFCSKNTKNTLLINNQTIRYDGTVVATNITKNLSEIQITDSNLQPISTPIPLYDVAKPSISNDSLFQPKLTSLGYIDKAFMANNEIFNPPSTDPLTYKYAMTTGTFIRDGALQLSPDVLNGDEGPELDALFVFVNATDNDNLLRHETYIENQMSFFWQKLSGPDCEFIEMNGGFSNTVRPSNTTANTRYIKLQISQLGRYVVQCTLNSPFGTFKKQKTIYVYDGADLMNAARSSSTGGRLVTLPPVPNPLFNKWYNNLTDTWEDVPEITSSPEFQPIYLNKDNLRIRCSKFNRLAISQVGGVVVPINTGFTVKELVGVSLPNIPQTEIIKLDELFKFKIDRSFTFASSANLSIQYNLGSTTAKIAAIYLEKLRNNLPGCEQCYSLYEPKLRAVKSTVSTGGGGSSDAPVNRTNTVRYSRVNKYPEGFVLYKCEALDDEATTVDTNDSIDFTYPIISTTSSPSVKTYGGYSDNFINKLGIVDLSSANTPPNRVPGLVKPLAAVSDRGVVAGRPFTLPPLTGFPLDATHDNIDTKHKLCFQHPVSYVGGGPMLFSKGVFHPNSGWLPYESEGYQLHANRSSVLKFNPGARDSFSFLGPRITNINAIAGDVLNNTVEPNLYTSVITLAMSQGVQWDPPCYCKNSDSNYSINLYNQNQLNKEYIDTTTNRSSHGYRYLYGGAPKPFERTALSDVPTYNDEFETDQTAESFKYSFAVTGPASVPTEVMGSDGKKHLRIPTVQNFGIKDIEIKLNFLNYVNTKNLVIWLEVRTDGAEGVSRKPDKNGKYPSPIKASKSTFIDQTIATSMVAAASSYQDYLSSASLVDKIPNRDTFAYLHELLETENDTPGGPLRLLLMNQEHIQNNGYNFSVKFSDHAPKHSVLYDQNIGSASNLNSISSTFAMNNDTSTNDLFQYIIRNNDSINPSLAAQGFSDRDACVYSRIIKQNRLNMTSTTFHKFVTDTLFKTSGPETGPCSERSPKQKDGALSSGTNFILRILVLDEADDMSPNDTLISNQYLTGLSSAFNTQKSTSIINSLCSWELILHIDDVPRFIPSTNPNLSSYGNCDALSLLDYHKGLKYPGYSFMADLTNQLEFLPLANIDAPNTSIADTSVCLASKNDPIGGGFVVKPAEFPSYAIIQILASTIPSTTGTIIGTATAPGIGYNQGFNAIIGWFSESRFLATLEDSGRQIYTPSFTKYPFGSPEKILLNIRKNNSLWHSLEATIMKYHNSPILQLRKHKYIKVQRNNGSKYISEFKINIVNGYEDLLDLTKVPSFSLPCDGSVILSTNLPQLLDDVLVRDGDIVNISWSSDTGEPCSDNYTSGLFVTTSAGWLPIKDDTLANLLQSKVLLQQNAILYAGSSLFTNDLQTLIQESKVIICDSRVPYDIFAINDQIEAYAESDRSETVSGTIINPKIIRKGLIYKNNKPYSVFVLDTPIEQQDYISALPNHNILFVYSDHDTKENGFVKPYGLWDPYQNGFINNSISSTPQHSAHSIGSYGNLSPFMSKNLLANNLTVNRLQNTHDILNNKYSDLIKYNKINIYAINGDSTLNHYDNFSNDILYGFTYSEKELWHNTQWLDNTNNIAVSPENIRQSDADFTDLESKIMQQIYRSAGYNEAAGSFAYVRTSNSISNTNSIPSSGMLTIDNDYIEFIPFEFIDIQTLNILTSRINTIDSTAINVQLESLIGATAATQTILTSSNIKYIKQHLDRIPDDQAYCYSQPNIQCYKLRTQTELSRLNVERSSILELLEQQTVSFAVVTFITDSGATKTIDGEIIAENNQSITILSSLEGSQVVSKSSILNNENEYGLNKSYTRKCDLNTHHAKYISNSILPKVKPIIAISNDGSCSIAYETTNNNHYWINIDPKQSCVLDFASNPKILDSVEHECIRANETSLTQFATVAANNNICPEFAQREGVPQGDFVMGGVSADNITFKDNSRKYKFTMPQSHVEYWKSRYASENPTITGWTKYIKDRYYNINADRSLGSEGAGSETTVKAIETYWIPEVNQSPTHNDGSADVLPAPGAGKCQEGGETFDSPAGLGLLEQMISRVNKSTRVYNILNLDNENNIEVQVKRVPRLLRGCDLLGTIYRYGNRSLFRQQSSSNPRIPLEIDAIGLDGSINNSMYCWHCLQHNIMSNTLEYASLPIFLQYQNEMIFRSFFGSVDRIENRSDLTLPYYPWELIPYEYSAN